MAVFFSTFLGVSRQGEFENTITIFWQKIRVANFFQNFDKTFRCQFFLDFFCFIAFSGVFQRWEFKNTRKNVLQKKSCRKVFTKKLIKSPKPIFSRKPRRFAPRPDTQRRSSGHRNTLAAHKLPACNSWRCSLIYAHPRGPRLPPAFGPKKAPALTPACESA